MAQRPKQAYHNGRSFRGTLGRRIAHKEKDIRENTVTP